MDYRKSHAGYMFATSRTVLVRAPHGDTGMRYKRYEYLFKNAAYIL